MYRECQPHVVAKDVTPNVTIEMVNGDIARFVFPVYNEIDGTLYAESLTDKGYTFKCFISDDPTGAVSATATIDDGTDKNKDGINVRNGIRLHIASHVESVDLDKYEWPLKIGFNIVATDDPDGSFAKGKNIDSFVHGVVIIKRAPFHAIENERMENHE